MPDLSANTKVTKDPGVYDYTHMGTAAGTTTIARQSTFLSHIQVNRRAASGAIIVYDSVGTSTNVVGSIVLGTQTFSDPTPFIYKVRTNNGLTISNTGDIDLTVASSV